MLRLELYVPEDREICREIARANRPRYFSDEDLVLFDEFLDQDFALDEARFWVLREEGQVVGFCGVEKDEEPTSCHMTWGVIHPDHQGRGLGRVLTEHRMRWIRENWPEVRFIQSMTSPATEGFFARYGFVTFHREADYWGEGYDLASMLLDLNPSRWEPAARSSETYSPPG